MRAAEHGGIDPRAAQVREVSLGDEPGHFAIRPSFLRERDEERAGPRDHRRERRQTPERSLVGAGSDRRRRPEDCDRSAPGARRRQLSARFDHAEDRDRQRRRQRRQAVRGDRVAGNDQQLDPMAREVARRHQRISGDNLAGARTVGNAGRVAEVDGVLVRKPRRQRPQHRQPAHAAVEHPDGRVGVHSAVVYHGGDSALTKTFAVFPASMR